MRDRQREVSVQRCSSGWGFHGTIVVLERGGPHCRGSESCDHPADRDRPVFEVAARRNDVVEDRHHEPAGTDQQSDGLADEQGVSSPGLFARPGDIPKGITTLDQQAKGQQQNYGLIVTRGDEYPQQEHP